MEDTERSPDLQELLLEATRLSESGEDSEALDLLLQAEPDFMEDSTLLCMIGALAGQLGAEGMAVDYFGRCLAQSPSDVEVLIIAGAGLAAAGDPGAEPALRLAALTAPAHPVARMQYGSLLVRNGLVDQGIEELEAARTLDPDDPEIHRDLGVALLLSGKLEKALEELETTVAADPEDPSPRLLWGLALLQDDDTSRAAEELHPLGEGMSSDGTVQLVLALTYAAAGWEDEAWLALARAEESDPPVDSATVREVEEALESGPEAAHNLLLLELAPMTLRERMFQA